MTARKNSKPMLPDPVKIGGKMLRPSRRTARGKSTKPHACRCMRAGCQCSSTPARATYQVRRGNLVLMFCRDCYTGHAFVQERLL